MGNDEERSVSIVGDEKMKKMIIYGSSDDCRIIGGDFSEEEYSDVAKVTDKDGKGLYIIWSYSEKVRNGCWCIGIQQLDEDVPIPDWARDVKVTMAKRGYSVVYELNVPDDIIIEWEDEE